MWCVMISTSQNEVEYNTKEYNGIEISEYIIY